MSETMNQADRASVETPEKVTVPFEQVRGVLKPEPWPIEGGLRVEIWITRRDDGGIQISSSLPGLGLSDYDPSRAFRDLGPAIETIVRHNGSVTAPSVASAERQLEANLHSRISLLEQQLKEAGEALEPFAFLASQFNEHAHEDSWHIAERGVARVCLGHCRRAQSVRERING